MSEWWEKYVGLIPCVSSKYPEENWIELLSSNNNSLCTYRFPCSNPQAILILFHGVHAHARSLAHIAKRFNEEGFLAASLDFENHGQSGGPRGRFSDMRAHFTDAVVYVEKVRLLYPHLPVFLLGESMGGMVAIAAALRLKYIAGLILLAPAIGAPGIGKCSRCLICSTARLFPNKELPPFDRSQLSSNQYLNQGMLDDPYTIKEPMNYRTAAALLSGMHSIHNQARLLTASVMIVQGGKDTVTCPATARRFFEAVPCPDKKLVYNEDMLHAVSAEPHIWDLIEEMLQWSRQKLDDKFANTTLLTVPGQG